VCAYYYRSYRRNWSRFHDSKRAGLRRVFGGIEKEIWAIFLSLPPYYREGLFKKYGAVFGPSKEQYARNAYPDWQARKVQPSAQTLERLVELLPPFLSESQRFDLLRKLRSHHLKRKQLSLVTTPDKWRNDLRPMIEEQFEHGKDFEIPAHVQERASWLADGNTQVAMKMLRAIELEEAQVRLVRVEDEFRRIELLLENVKYLQPVYHQIVLPQGDIHVTIHHRQKSALEKLGSMLRSTPNMDNQLIPKQTEGQLARRENPGSLLNTALKNLTPEQQARITEKVIDEKIQLDVSAEKAEQRYQDSSRDMANVVRAAQAIEQTQKNDFDIHSTHDTASGRTEMRIKKNGNTVIIVIAIVLGLIIFTLLRK